MILSNNFHVLIRNVLRCQSKYETELVDTPLCKFALFRNVIEFNDKRKSYLTKPNGIFILSIKRAVPASIEKSCDLKSCWPLRECRVSTIYYIYKIVKFWLFFILFRLFRMLFDTPPWILFFQMYDLYFIFLLYN